MKIGHIILIIVAIIAVIAGVVIFTNSNNEEVNVGVEARIHDSESLKTVDYSHEYVPSVIGECLVKNSQIDDYVDAGGADETRRRYCNAHPGYGGAVIVTW